ncbi:MAG: HD domain-containing protein, partial [Brevefilum sp.]
MKCQALNLDSILTAATFAAQKHHGQVRKDQQASPYVTHPLTVARLIYTIGEIQDQDILIAAILHDTLEDTNTRPEDLQEHFGTDVLAMVLEVTDDKSLPKLCRKQLQVIHAPQLSYPARIIKLADKIVNCTDILRNPPVDWSLTRRQEYIQWAADVVFQIRGTNAPLEQAFDELFAEAEALLNFHLQPFDTVSNRAWGPGANDTCE